MIYNINFGVAYHLKVTKSQAGIAHAFFIYYHRSIYIVDIDIIKDYMLHVYPTCFS